MDKEKKSRFLKKNFLLNNLFINVIVKMLLFNLNNLKVYFLEL